MKLNRIHFIEKFAIVTFPIALAVGCTTTADQEYKVMQNAGQHVTQNVRDDVLKEDFSSSLNTSTAMSTAQSETMQIQESTMDTESGENSHNIEKELQTAANDSLLEVKLNLPASEANIKKAELPEKGIFHFAVNKHQVAETDHQVLQQHARYLKENINMTLYVDGFSDNRGPAHLNYQLSKKRAQQIAKLLIEYGAPESRLKVNGYGESFPLTSENNWDENRRVELEYGYFKPSDELFANLN